MHQPDISKSAIVASKYIFFSLSFHHQLFIPQLSKIPYEIYSLNVSESCRYATLAMNLRKRNALNSLRIFYYFQMEADR